MGKQCVHKNALTCEGQANIIIINIWTFYLSICDNKKYIIVVAHYYYIIKSLYEYIVKFDITVYFVLKLNSQ